jgi:hypothetical protein
MNPGWWLTYPSEKYDSQMGLLLFPIYRKMFQTTNQYLVLLFPELTHFHTWLCPTGHPKTKYANPNCSISIHFPKRKWDIETQIVPFPDNNMEY